MAKVTLIFAFLLVALGVVGYLGTGGLHPTALIPTSIGLVLGLFGLLAMSDNASRRKLFMHINVTVALLGFLGATAEAVRGYVHAQLAGLVPDPIALASKISMALLLLIYVILCVQSFIAARRTRRV